MFAYSSDFIKLTQDPKDLRDLLDNCSFAGTFSAWEDRKAFLAKGINRQGTFLDIGCGNGFLLRCLQEWSEYELSPYGLDVNAAYIQKAKQLFTAQPENFMMLDSRDIQKMAFMGFPNQFDFVYASSIWRGTENEQIKRFASLVKSGGRLLIGFYDDDRTRNNNARKAFIRAGVRFSGTVTNSLGSNLMTWIDC